MFFLKIPFFNVYNKNEDLVLVITFNKFEKFTLRQTILLFHLQGFQTKALDSSEYNFYSRTLADLKNSPSDRLFYCSTYKDFRPKRWTAANIIFTVAL